MQTHNLSGSAAGKSGVPAGCYLRPHNDNGEKTLEAQVYPTTEIAVGDEVFYKVNASNQPVIKKVKEVAERRK